MNTNKKKVVMKKINSLLFVLAIILVSCDKESVNSDTENVSEADLVSVELALEEAEVVLDNIVLYSENSFGVQSSITSKSSTSKNAVDDKRGRSGFFRECADITIEIMQNTIIKTIVFNQGCVDNDGNEITGTIIKSRSKTDSSKERTVTIEDLSINGRVVNGTKTYTFMQSNDNGNPEMTGSVNISVETEDGTKSKVGTRTIEITAGGDTDSHFDDEKTITGSSEYTNKEGETLTVTITTPLVKPAECRYIASGVKEYVREAGTTLLDFGDGTCDNIAIKTAPDGTETEVELRKKRKHKK